MEYIIPSLGSVTPKILILWLNMIKATPQLLADTVELYVLYEKKLDSSDSSQVVCVSCKANMSILFCTQYCLITLRFILPAALMAAIPGQFKVATLI